MENNFINTDISDEFQELIVICMVYVVSSWKNQYMFTFIVYGILDMTLNI
jgi:hypothetical protein